MKLSILKLRKVIALSLCMIILLSTGIVTHAQTSTFTLTVTKSGHGEDPISKRTEKAGGSKYENTFYVTPKSYRGVGSVIVKSVSLNNSAVQTGEIVLSSSNVGKTRCANYNKYAASNTYYYMQGRYAKNSTSASINVTGNYTP